ncbi:hypothetical protein PIROE2DRAFT_66312 [Piromyces sp. E2]|nr:hypothetical protein PIROE2DRAFT_66312 [Piromyces sp. E2]|eukprot:OUM62810.1 hypothetical protein PIROE2DRAFT_66312 [Piromyces sp. E2]
MGISFSKLFEGLWNKKEIGILMVSISFAGKTTILYQLKLGQFVTSIPTIGFNAETVKYKNINFKIWDVGGGEKIRSLWRHYYKYSNGIIFVVDSNDRKHIEESRDELQRISQEEELKDRPFLIFANKQDLPSAMSVSEITDKLGLKSIKQDWHIQGSCAITGDGLYEGLEWLTTNINNK